MEPRSILPSYPSPQLDESSSSHTRLPLSEAAGNSQIPALASSSHYHESKYHPRVDISRFVPTVPSQRDNQTHRRALSQRRQAVRSQRTQRFLSGRNPILESPQYRAYRDRQTRDGADADAKWPEELENAFLDALLAIPPMGRRKFSMHGKPHGRNELIKEYLWIAYTQSLAPGAHIDRSMERTRKQVSSHIQVLKGFLKGHPAYDRLFPPKVDPKNGFEDSFKNDMTLVALANGRLPDRRYDSQQIAMEPVLFWLHLEDQNGSIVHPYTRLSTKQHRASLDTIPDWRQKFPHLLQLYATGDINCEVIHMNVTLDLTTKTGSKLSCHAEISIPGGEAGKCNWQAVTSLIRPPELCKDPVEDPPIDSVPFPAKIQSFNSFETRVKVRFEPLAWAHILSNLTSIKLTEDRQQACGDDISHHLRPVREYVEQISMYQDLQSSTSGTPFGRCGLFLWTFRLAEPGEKGKTTWRHIDVSPPRSVCMSPSPQPSQHFSATMNENFHAFMDGSIQFQQSSILNPYVQGLATPPTTGGLQSPFDAQIYSYPVQPFNMSAENLSFMSTATVDSGFAMVNHESPSIGSFLSNAHANMADYNHNVAAWDMNHSSEPFDVDHSIRQHNVAESSIGDNAWNYSVATHTHTPPTWENDHNQSWPEVPVSTNDAVALKSSKKEWELEPIHDCETNDWEQLPANGHEQEWPEENMTAGQEWTPIPTPQVESPSKQLRWENHSYGQNIPGLQETHGEMDEFRETHGPSHSDEWDDIDPLKAGHYCQEVEHSELKHWMKESVSVEEGKPKYHDDKTSHLELPPVQQGLPIEHTGDHREYEGEQEESWIGSDGYDYSQLAERLKHDA